MYGVDFLEGYPICSIRGHIWLKGIVRLSC